ncbi:PTS transporter subunit EIIC [Photobacterium sp. BZF1]|uniref:Uncharacterized protein n=1 Tax=Photobacterium rosenbergii TaxID=294936 RepID=A0A2T3NDU2_9GAMM|nr:MULTISPECIES: PTS transporter subunit EIIC [Photobacterium]MBC7003810.1 PTS transporter subunit EIIC [Photobacterium sp. BZF1]MBY5946697.1 PTS transporter subunit EIIC [Photobacterium rosenbergii]PSW12365.1 hypothetical protein C9J01_14445 [Photobacterium rosenbergii]
MNLKNLDSVQRFAKAMLFAVTFILPFAAIMISLGTIGMSPMLLGGIPYVGDLFAFVGKYLNVGGWVILANLPFFFALCVASSLTGNKQAGPVIIAGLFFLMVHKLIGEMSVWYFGSIKGFTDIQAPMDLLSPIANPEYVNIFQDVLGMPTFRIGIVGAIIVGILSARIWEKYKTFDKLPMALDFFNGQRFCVFVTFIYAFIMAAVLMVVWPIVGDGLDAFSIWAAQNGDYAAPFSKAFLETALRPIGLHHVTNAVWEYTPIGGEFYSELKDMTIIGLHQVGPARLDEIVQLFNLGRISDAQAILADPMMNKMMFYQDFHGLFTLPGAALGMYLAIPKERRTAKIKSIYLSTTLAVVFTGFSEPLEFMFVFASPVLYGVNVAFQSIISMMPDFFKHMFDDPAMMTWYFRGLPNLLTNYLVQVGFILGRWYELVILFGTGVIWFLIYGVTFNFIIRKMDVTILGREKEDEAEEANDSFVTRMASQSNKRVEAMVHVLGGLDNIDTIDNCMTRLRLSVHDKSKVDMSKKTWQKLGALDVVDAGGNNIQAIYGASVSNIKIQLEDYVDEARSQTSNVANPLAFE